MKILTAIAILASILLMGQVTTATAQVTDAPGAPRYRWTVTADGSSQLWRQHEQSVDRWQPAGRIPDTVMQVVAYAAAPDTAYARTRFALYVTESNSAIWRELPRLPGIPTAVAVGQQTPGLLYLGTSDLGAFRSNDGGATWEQLEGLGLQPGTILDVSAIAVNPADEHIVFAAAGYWTGSTTMHYSPEGISVSVDGGETWLPLYDAPTSGPRIVHLFTEDVPSLTVQAVTDDTSTWHTYSDTALLVEQMTTGTTAERAAAVKALALVARDLAAETLLNRLTGEPDAAVGQTIAHVLGPLATVQMIPVLLVDLQNENDHVRWRAATVLGYVPHPLSIKALGWVVRHDDSIARSAASEALIRIGTPAAAAEVLALLDTPDLDADKHVALATLEGIGDPAVNPLVDALADASVLVRQNAAEALGWIGSSRAVEALAVALNDSEPQVRLQAAGALNRIGTVEARDLLVASIPVSPAGNDPLTGALPWLAMALVGSTVVGGAYVAANYKLPTQQVVMQRISRPVPYTKRRTRGYYE